MPKIKLGSDTILGRLLQRFGRLVIFLLIFAVGALVYLGLELFIGLEGILLQKYILAIPPAAMYGTYLLIDRLNLVPDDPDKIMTLSLSEPSKDSEK